MLVTCHRAENTDDSERLSQIVDGLARVAEEVRVILPLHPRTRKMINENGLMDRLGNVELLDPISFLDMVILEESAKVIITDSGGVQKEAYFFGVPCITMRDETEWVETVDSGWNKLVGADTKKIVQVFYALADIKTLRELLPLYGDGGSSKKIIGELLRGV